jgi:hypothetical protein
MEQQTRKPDVTFDGTIADIAVIERRSHVEFRMKFRERGSSKARDYAIPPNLFFGYVFSYGDGNPRNLIGKTARWRHDEASGEFTGLVAWPEGRG